MGKGWFCLLLFILSFGTGDVARAQDSKEYQLKAVFLFNFAQFVKWPASCFARADAPFTIGILGDDPFGNALDETIRGENIEHHKLVVMRAQRVDDLKDCQMIFISRSEGGHVSEILAQLEGRPVLTVSEVESFARDGGTINFYIVAGKVHFEINPGSAQHQGLKISSQLLSLGRIVQSGGN
jgi:hypothetical protein